MQSEADIKLMVENPIEVEVLGLDGARFFLDAFIAIQAFARNRRFDPAASTLSQFNDVLDMLDERRRMGPSFRKGYYLGRLKSSVDDKRSYEPIYFQGDGWRTIGNPTLWTTVQMRDIFDQITKVDFQKDDF